MDSILCIALPSDKFINIIEYKKNHSRGDSSYTPEIFCSDVTISLPSDICISNDNKYC